MPVDRAVLVSGLRELALRAGREILAVYGSDFAVADKADASPVTEADTRAERVILDGQVPSPLNKPAGCPFHPRCPYRQQRCEGEVPELRPAGDGRLVACHFAEELELRGSLQSDVMGRLGLS